MAEQGIEQAAKAGLLAGTPWVTWDKLDKTGQEFWLRIARAMQPHLARERGELNADLRAHVDGDEILKRLQGAYIASGLCEGMLPRDWQVIIDRFLTAAQVQRPQAEPVFASTGVPHSSKGAEQSAGDTETMERAKKALYGVPKKTFYAAPADIESSLEAVIAVAREGYVPAQALEPVTDEEVKAAFAAYEQATRRRFDEDSRKDALNTAMNWLLADRLRKSEVL